MKRIISTLISFESTPICLEWCRNFLKKRGISAEIKYFVNSSILIWGAAPKNAKIMINSHIDVVPAPKSSFKPIFKENKIFGRGSADAKSSVAVLLSLDKEIIAKASKKGVVFSLVCDEEIGGASTKEFITTLKKLKLAIFGERTNLTINNQAKGIAQVQIISRGVAAHGASPWKGKNAILGLSRQLETFLTTNPLPTKETRKTTFNFSKIQGGRAINQVPDTCILECDIRFNPNESFNKVLDLLKSNFKFSKIKVLKLESPISTSPNNLFVTQFADAMKKEDIPIRFSFEHSSSDARHCTALKIPAIAFGPIGNNIHQNNEWVSIPSILRQKRVLEKFLLSNFD